MNNNLNKLADLDKNFDYNVYVLKDQNDKVRKPKEFVGTDLSKYVPSELMNHLV